MRILYIAEMVGSPGVYCVKNLLKSLKEKLEVDCVIANADGATGGYGIGKNHAIYLRKLGVDVLTSGDCIFNKVDMPPYINSVGYIIRPANHPAHAPGRGWRHIMVGDINITVINLMGQAGHERNYVNNPFAFFDENIARITRRSQITIVDFHGRSTADKLTMGYLANGKVSAVIGSGQRTQTADATILSNGTAVICDAGRTGSQFGVIGFDPEVEIRKFIRQIPERSKECWQDLEAQGVVLEVGDDFRATSITPFREPIASPNGERSR